MAPIVAAPTGSDREAPCAWLAAHVKSASLGYTDHRIACHVQHRIGFLGASAEALMSVNEPQWIPIDLAWCLGAAKYVADTVGLPGHNVSDSEGSRRRQMILADDGQELPNEGEVKIAMEGDVESIVLGWTQITAVERPARISEQNT